MNRERIKLIIQNMELLISALKEELQESSVIHPIEHFTHNDYDEVFDE